MWPSRRRQTLVVVRGNAKTPAMRSTNAWNLSCSRNVLVQMELSTAELNPLHQNEPSTFAVYQLAQGWAHGLHHHNIPLNLGPGAAFDEPVIEVQVDLDTSMSEVSSYY